jgi:hypothetical protein
MGHRPVSETRRDIEHGFHIEEPDLFVPWGIGEAQLLALLGVRATKVAPGYITCSCTSLGGLGHQLGFHFQPKAKGVLTELEFFRTKYPDERASFEEFQQHLEATFGTPRSDGGIMGYPAYLWEFETVAVRHFMAYRYMVEEHVRIQKRV